MIDIILLTSMGVLIIIAALCAIFFKNLISAVVASGVVSLLASIFFLIAKAPDVAMTEAVIGSGLTTMVFLYALNKVRNKKEEPND